MLSFEGNYFASSELVGLAVSCLALVSLFYLNQKSTIIPPFRYILTIQCDQQAKDGKLGFAKDGKPVLRLYRLIGTDLEFFILRIQLWFFRCIQSPMNLLQDFVPSTDKFNFMLLWYNSTCQSGGY